MVNLPGSDMWLWVGGKQWQVGKQAVVIHVRMSCACFLTLLVFLGCTACPLVPWAEACPQRFLPQWVTIIVSLYTPPQHWRGTLL